MRNPTVILTDPVLHLMLPEWKWPMIPFSLSMYDASTVCKNIGKWECVSNITVGQTPTVIVEYVKNHIPFNRVGSCGFHSPRL